MEIIRGLHNLRPRHQGCAVTIGNFDGVHSGHQALLRHLNKQAQARNLPSLLIIFEPQPREYFLATKAPPRLTNLREKLELLQQTEQLHYVLCLSFNERLGKRSPASIIEQLLVRDLNVRYILVGDDFRFGTERQGDFSLLKQAGQQYNFDVESLDTVLAQKERVSSSLIRELLKQGDISQAEQLLGHAYFMTGRVIRGRELGRTIGVPTANIRPNRHQAAVNGVFAVSVSGVGNRKIPGLANVGMRPTVNGQDLLLEVHLLDFDEPLYGRRLHVQFQRKIREEEKFSGIEPLRAQIERDIRTVRNWLQEGDLTETR